MPGVAGSSGSGVRAGAHGGVCVLCASACLYRKEPTYSFRFQTSLISPAVPATLGRGSFRRRPTVLPSSPPARGSPPRHRAHRPPHGRCRGPGSARRAGTLSQRWVLCPYSLAHGRGKERIGGGWRKSLQGWSKGDGDAGRVCTGLGQPASWALLEDGYRAVHGARARGEGGS